MTRPSWWPVRPERSHTATNDYEEARFREVELAMARALIARIGAIGWWATTSGTRRAIDPRSRVLVLEGDAWDAMKAEVEQA